MLWLGKRRGEKGMRKETVKSLTKKGLSQKRIALKLHLRKSKVVAEQKKLGIGKRRVSKFWQDVESIKRMKGISHKKATKEVKYSSYWFKKRQKGLRGTAKARDEMKEKWQRIKQGDIEPNWWEEAGGEDLLEAAEYD